MSEYEHNMEHEALNFEKDQAWERERSVDIRSVIDSLDENARRELFARTDTRVGCMDEGCVDCGFRIAGSGILIKEEDRPAFEDNCRKMGATEVTHHEGCGAAGVYAKKIKSEKDPAQLAKEFSAHVAADIGVADSYVPAEEMSRPKEFHSTRFAYYDGTGRLNLQAAEGKLPNGFVLTRGLYPKAEYAIAEAELAFNIAAGDHGFGERITNDEPFTIIVIGNKEDPQFSQEALAAELEPLAANGKIKIIGFAASSQQSAKDLPLAA